MKTIYSIRDSLGRELWWTTGRKAAITLAAELNESGIGALVTEKGKCGHDYKRTDPRCLTRDTVPVSVYRCSMLTANTRTPEKQHPARLQNYARKNAIPNRLLSERRAVDREVMADRLIAACQEAGGTAARVDSIFGDRRIDVRITAPGGATIRVDFDGRSSQPDVFAQTWNVVRPAYEAGMRLRDWEGNATAKRNTIARGFDQLVLMLTTDIAGFVLGNGYWR